MKEVMTVKKKGLTSDTAAKIILQLGTRGSTQTVGLYHVHIGFVDRLCVHC